MEKQINAEIQKIRDYEEIIEKSLVEYANNYPNDLKNYNVKHIVKFISYLIDGEIDYIVCQPKEYLEELND